MSNKHPTASHMQSRHSISALTKMACLATDLDSLRRYIPGGMEQTANINSAHPPRHHSHSNTRSACCNKIKHRNDAALTPEQLQLKSFPSTQVPGKLWVLDVLEDLIAFSQENDMPNTVSAISKAYAHAAEELQN